MVSTNVSFSRGDIDLLGKSIAKNIGSNRSSDIFSGTSDTSKTGGVDTTAILNSIKAKAQAQIDKKQVKTDKFTDEKDALSNLQSISSNLSSSIQGIKSTGGTGLFNSFAATGVPAGVTVTPAAGAAVGSHTMSVSSIASKQTIVIQSKDAAGNPVPFAADAADVTAAAPTDGAFTRGRNFNIYNNSNNNGAALATISPGGPVTLQAIADLINASAASTVLTATIHTDSTGDKLVLESIDAGTASNFYIDDRDITGLDRSLAVTNTSAINTLSVTPSYDDVKSIDIYSKNGNFFASRNTDLVGPDEACFQPGTWNIGGGFVSFESVNVKSLDTMVTKINSDQIHTGVSAKVVTVTGGYIIRVTASHGTALNYNPESTFTIFTNGTATATRIRPSTASDTEITIDGVNYNAGGDLIINTPNADLASITVSAPTPLTTFSVTQDTAKLTESITTLVNSINDAQQFIFQQRDEDASLFSSNTLNQLTSMINKLTSNSTNVMSLNKMGITWTDYTPTSAEKKDGIVPARYLSINPTTLSNMITSNFDDVKGFFVGAFSHAAGDATATLSSASNILSMPQFDLTVACISVGPPATFTATASTDGGTTLVALTPVWLGGTKLLITGVAGTIFEGLSINYNYTGAGGLAGLSTSGPAGYTMPNITVYNGAVIKLSQALTSYLDVYGPLENAITDRKNKIISSSKETKRILEARDKKLAQAQARIQKIRLQTIMFESLKKSLEGK